VASLHPARHPARRGRQRAAVAALPDRPRVGPHGRDRQRQRNPRRPAEPGEHPAGPGGGRFGATARQRRARRLTPRRSRRSSVVVRKLRGASPIPNWSPRIEVHRHGREQQPVIVVDDYARDPEQIVAEAAALAYGPGGQAYPGVRAAAPAGLVLAIRDGLGALIQETFGLGQPLNRIEAYFSLITTPPEALSPIQRLPHFDGLGRERIALMFHLTRAEGGATAFYRHRSTGFESMDAARLPAYNAAVNDELQRLGLPPAGYIAGDTPIYQRVARYEARFNRLLVYRGATLHSGEPPPGLSLAADPRTGRFSLNAFFWLEPPPQPSP
jgi:hypothetical protein